MCTTEIVIWINQTDKLPGVLLQGKKKCDEIFWKLLFFFLSYSSPFSCGMEHCCYVHAQLSICFHALEADNIQLQKLQMMSRNKVD